MPTLAGWLTGEQVTQTIIEQTLFTMGEVLGRHGGEPMRTVLPGAGFLSFSDPAYAVRNNDEPPVLDWVSDRRTLVYRRPLTGFHPLYYIQDWPAQGNLLFASEIKALFAVGVPRRLHLSALQTLLHNGFIPAPWTAFKDIFIVPAGSILRWQKAKTVVNHASDFHFGPTHSANITIDQLIQTLHQASNALLPPHEQFTTLIDGDTPSALSAFLSAQHTHAAFMLSSIGYTTSTDDAIWDNVQEIADTCDKPLLSIAAVDQADFWITALTATEAPAIDTRPVMLHQLLHATANETGTRVAMTGLGLHTLLGLSPPSISTVPRSKQPLLPYYISQARTARAPAAIWSVDAVDILQREEPWEKTHHACKLERQLRQYTDPAQGLHYLNLHLHLPDYLVKDFYQLATHERLAIRSPYLHPHVTELLIQLATGLTGITERQHLLQTLCQRHGLTLSRETHILPLRYKTRIFEQVQHSDLLQHLLAEEKLRKIGLFEPGTVQTLLSQSPANEETVRTLLFIFTTQLLCHLFNITSL